MNKDFLELFSYILISAEPAERGEKMSDDFIVKEVRRNAWQLVEALVGLIEDPEVFIRVAEALDYDVTQQLVIDINDLHRIVKGDTEIYECE